MWTCALNARRQYETEHTISQYNLSESSRSRTWGTWGCMNTALNLFRTLNCYSPNTYYVYHYYVQHGYLWDMFLHHRIRHDFDDNVLIELIEEFDIFLWQTSISNTLFFHFAQHYVWRNNWKSRYLTNMNLRYTIYHLPQPDKILSSTNPAFVLTTAVTLMSILRVKLLPTCDNLIFSTPTTQVLLF